MDIQEKKYSSCEECGEHIPYGNMLCRSCEYQECVIDTDDITIEKSVVSDLNK